MPTYDRNGRLSGAPAEEKPQTGDTSPATGNDSQMLDEGEQAEVRRLRATDRKVRQHEQAHLAAGAGITRGGANFSYKRGPDGVLYAVGGEVSIDTSGGKTPEETIAKMKRVKAAALAPADPSPQDRRVAAAAAARASRASAELAAIRRDESGEGPDPDSDGADRQI